MEAPAVTDRTLSGPDSDRRNLSLREDRFDCVDDIAQKEEKALENIEENATSLMALNSEFTDETGETSQREKKTLEKLIVEDIKIREDAITLREDESGCADDTALKEEEALENVEENATSLRAAESEFLNENVSKVEAETSHKEDNCETIHKEENTPEKIEEDATSLMALNSEFTDETGETSQKEEKTLEKLIVEDIKIRKDAITLREDESGGADDTTLKEEKALENVEEDATSLRAAESEFLNENVHKVEARETSHKEDNCETIRKEENTPEKIEEDATSLRASEFDFANESVLKVGTEETSHKVDDVETIQKDENVPETPVVEKDMEIKDDAITLREDGSDCADNIAQQEENGPEKIEEDATSLRAAESDFSNEISREEETVGSDKEDSGETIQKEEKTPEKSVVEDLRIEEDASSLREKGSDCADDTANDEETAPENIQEYATSLGDERSYFMDAHETYRKEDENAKAENKIPEKSIVENVEKIQDDATRLRGEGSGCADGSIKEEEKASPDIYEGSNSFEGESSDFADETTHKEDTISEKSIVDEDKKIQDDATSLSTNGSDCSNDAARAEEKSPVKSTAEQIQDATKLRVQNTDFLDETARKEETDKNVSEEEKNQEQSLLEKDQKIEEDVAASLRAHGFDCVDGSAREEEKTPVQSTIELIQEDAASSGVQNSDFVDEIARGVSNNHVVVDEPGKIEENTQKQSSQAKGEPDILSAPRLASTSERITNPASSAAPSAVHPAGLGRAARLLEPTPRAFEQSRVNGSTSQMQTQQIEDSNGEAEEYDETREQLQMIRVKFLRLAHRLGQTPHNVVVAQVLYRLGLAEQIRGRNGGRVGAYSFDRASAMAEQLEAAGQEPLDFSCTIMVLGKTGVGKSATINSIFDEQRLCTDAFQMGTQKVHAVVGTVQGIKVRVIDTPGLLSFWSDQRKNVKILHSVKQFIKKTPPDIVLYLDRLDMQCRDFGDMPLLRSITDTFGPSIWFNAIVVLTHAASAPPDGPNGTASSYDMFVTQRSHVVQQSIRQAAGDTRLMNPISLVENHSACRTNRAGQRVLPNGQVWKPHLLLLSFASKILAEANTLLKLPDSSPGKPSTTQSRAPPLPFLLSSLLQSRPQLRLPGEQVGGDEDDDLDGSSDSDNEVEYGDLPPFTRLTKAQVAMLTKAQKRAYFDELAYREKLLMKQQLKEEKRQRKIMKEMAASGRGAPSENSENVEESDTAIPPAPVPDIALPASFDSSNPTHRYRCLDSASQWIVRPVLDTHGWDRDVGYEGINVERFFVVKNKLPVTFSGQASKDKKDANVQMEINSSLSHGEGKSTSMGFDLQTAGKDMTYTLRGETKFCNHRRNKATAGLSATILGDALSTGVKLEDKLIINKCLRMVMAGGAMTNHGDVAYGGSFEAQWRDKDYPIGRFLSTLGLSIMDWHGDLAIGGNIQSQIPIGRSTNLIARANLNNRGAGQINIRLNSSEQLQIALVGLIPLLRKVADQFLQLQYGQQ